MIIELSKKDSYIPNPSRSEDISRPEQTSEIEQIQKDQEYNDKQKNAWINLPNGYEKIKFFLDVYFKEKKSLDDTISRFCIDGGLAFRDFSLSKTAKKIVYYDEGKDLWKIEQINVIILIAKRHKAIEELVFRSDCIEFDCDDDPTDLVFTFSNFLLVIGLIDSNLPDRIRSILGKNGKLQCKCLLVEEGKEIFTIIKQKFKDLRNPIQETSMIKGLLNKLFSKKGLIVLCTLFLIGLVAFLANAATVLQYLGYPNIQSIIKNKISSTQSQIEPAPFKKNFNFEKASLATIPSGWSPYGGLPEPFKPNIKSISQQSNALVFPTIDIETINTNNFSGLDNILLYNNLNLVPPFTITSKLNFQTEGDNAGIIIGWVDSNHCFRIEANIHNSVFEIWQNIPGKTEPLRMTGGLEKTKKLLLQKDYWIRIIASKNQIGIKMYDITIQFSEDGKNWDIVDDRQGLSGADLSGKIGLMTTGPHHPEVYFYNLDIKKPSN